MPVIAVTISPWRGYKTWSRSQQRGTDEINAFIRSQPAGVRAVADIWSALVDPDRPERLRPDYQRRHDQELPCCLGGGRRACSTRLPRHGLSSLAAG